MNPKYLRNLITLLLFVAIFTVGCNQPQGSQPQNDLKNNQSTRENAQKNAESEEKKNEQENSQSDSEQKSKQSDALKNLRPNTDQKFIAFYEEPEDDIKSALKHGKISKYVATFNGIPVTFVPYPEEKLFRFYFNRNMGLFNAKDELVLKPEYNFLFPSEGVIAGFDIYDKKTNVFLNDKGEVLLDVSKLKEYNPDVSSLTDDVVKKLDGLTFLGDYSLLADSWDEDGDSKESEDIFVPTYIIDKKGKILFEGSKEIEYEIFENHQFVKYDKSNKTYTLLDQDKNVLYRGKYMVIDFKESRKDLMINIVEDYENTGLRLFDKKTGKPFSEELYDSIIPLGEYFLQYKQRKDSENIAGEAIYQIVDTKGNLKLDLSEQYPNIFRFEIVDKYLCLILDNSKLVWLDETLNIMKEEDLKKAVQSEELSSNHMIIIRIDGKYGIKNIFGELLVEPMFDHISSQCDDFVFCTIEKGGWGNDSIYKYELPHE